MDATGWLLMVWAIILVGIVLGLTLSSRVYKGRGDDWLDPFSMTGQAREKQRRKAWAELREAFREQHRWGDDLDKGGYIAGEISEEEAERLTRRFYGRESGGTDTERANPDELRGRRVVYMSTPEEHKPFSGDK